MQRALESESQGLLWCFCSVVPELPVEGGPVSRIECPAAEVALVSEIPLGGCGELIN